VLPARGRIALIVLSGLDVHADPDSLLQVPENADAGFGTLLFDLLTEAEAADRSKVFDTSLLAERLAARTEALASDSKLSSLPIGYFGASTGAAAALQASVSFPDRVSAIVSRGGRPDLAGEALGRVEAPTLLIVGGDDSVVLELNRRAQDQLRGPNQLVVIPGAGHLFEEPGALEAVSEHAANWFTRHLGGSRG
jgi:pimeloyl-ACP methyl ester carboxylesterase